MARRAFPLLAATLLLARLAAGSQPRAAAAQADPDGGVPAALASWVAVDAATGYETRIASTLAAALGAGWTADRWGNVVASVGSGAPHRVVACALDRPNLAVSQIRDDGYLRVHRIGNGSTHPLWDQQFEAQQARIMTANGAVAGVFARANGHFGPQHAAETAPVKADDLWLDVGATSRAEVAGLGITLLDPVSRQLPPWPMIGAVGGPDAGRRVGCAAVAALASAARPAGLRGRVSFVLSAQQVTGWVGLSSLVAHSERVDEITILAPGEEARREVERPLGELGNFGRVLDAAGLRGVRWLAPAVEQAGSHMEVVRQAEAEWLLAAAAEPAGLPAAPRAWLPAPAPAPLETRGAAADLAQAASALTDLVERHGVSTHEWAVRRAILAALPAWARDRAIVDDVGNITVEAGPPGEATVFMAHMDEVGFLIDAIAPDGTVALTVQGGAVASAWEGQTALLHFDPAGAPSLRSGQGVDMNPSWKTQSLAAAAPPPLRGVFRIRARAAQKNPGPLQAWFGLDGAALAARGVVPGMQVTNDKAGLRLGPTRFTARSLDDRAGSLALLRAVQRIEPDRLPARTIFAWSVGEEGGLRGAQIMARRFARRTARIYSIDTFVTSDTPLESPHFALARLGSGPVLRAIESGAISPDAERQRVIAIAAAAQVPLQIGLTQGGTDGSTFMFWGAPNQGLSWPGRYSHSPGEVLDLGDLERLTTLIAAVAAAR